MTDPKILSVEEYKRLRFLGSTGVLPVRVHTFKPGELKQIRCYGIYIQHHGDWVWVSTLDSIDEVLTHYPTAEISS